MFCTECGTKVVGAGKFCTNCGTKLTQPERSVIEDAGKATNVIASSDMETDSDSIIQHAKEAYGKKDYNEAAKLSGVLAEQGNAEAQCMLGLCFYRPDTPKEDYPKAVKWFRLAAEQGYSEAQYYLGDCFHSGTGIEENKKEGIRWVRMAAEQGYAEAQYYLGYWYFCGDGVAEDSGEACKWYRKAAEQGYKGAIEQLMLLDCDYLHDAAERGSVEAQYELGIKHLREHGVMSLDEKDCREAVKWLSKPAEQGYNNAHNDLGLAYFYLSKYDADSGKEAVKWLRIGAEQGDSESQRFLGQCYREGIGVKQSNSIAIEWFSKAAAQGHAIANIFIEEMRSDEDEEDDEIVSSGNVIELSSIRQHHSERDNILALREKIAALTEEGKELLTRYSELIKDQETVSEALIVNNAQIKNIEGLKGVLTKLYDFDDVTDEFYENHMEVLEDKLGRLSELNQRIQDYIKQEKRGKLDKKLRNEFWNEVGDLSDEGGAKGLGMRFGKAFLNALFKTARDDIREKQGDIE